MLSIRFRGPAQQAQARWNSAVARYQFNIRITATVITVRFA
jgi:hypothetical protein